MKLKKKLVDEMCQWVAENGLMDYGGASLKEFLENFVIDQKTYYNWLKKSEFSDALEKAKQVYLDSLERRIVSSLGRAAMGGEWEEVRQEFREGEDGKPHPVRMTKTKKKIEPNVGAAVFLLTNRFPERWQNKQVADVKVRTDETRLTHKQMLDEIQENRRLYEGRIGEILQEEAQRDGSETDSGQGGE
ncbi:MAG: hypothetical protein LUI09_03675 [Prevotellaceae bacterium]|nr:hypothetical protein [Prevotellaceae bacterium]